MSWVNIIIKDKTNNNKSFAIENIYEFCIDNIYIPCKLIYKIYANEYINNQIDWNIREIEIHKKANLIKFYEFVGKFMLMKNINQFDLEQELKKFIWNNNLIYLSLEFIISKDTRLENVFQKLTI